MNTFVRKAAILTATAALSFGTLASTGAVHAQSPIVVTWFVGLGTGTDTAQKDAQNAVVDAFNKSQSAIQLKINIAASNQTAPDVFSTLIASGNAPDIVGPMGFEGANQFPGQWLDLTSEVATNKVDLSAFDPALVKVYQDPAYGLVGLPFAVYPGMMFYNKDLFDAANLAYPPSKVGDMYKLNGKDVPWNYDTVSQVAQLLTLDKNGNDATTASFDPKNIVQYGFVHQYGTIRSEFQTFGGAPVADASGKVNFPQAWIDEAQWTWNGLWKYHFIPNQTATASTLLQPNEFASGKVAMARVMSWFTCCVTALKSKWDLGVQPAAPDGKTYAPNDADTFRITKGTKNPDAAFTVLQYLLGAAASPLLTTYGAFPARPDLQKTVLAADAAKFPSVTHWDIINAQLAYAPSPHHESSYPGYNPGQADFTNFRTLLYGDTGASIDVKAEMAKLQTKIQADVNAGDKPITAPTAAPTMAATKSS